LHHLSPYTHGDYSFLTMLIPKADLFTPCVSPCSPLRASATVSTQNAQMVTPPTPFQPKSEGPDPRTFSIPPKSDDVLDWCTARFSPCTAKDIKNFGTSSHSAVQFDVLKDARYLSMTPKPRHSPHYTGDDSSVDLNTDDQTAIGRDLYEGCLISKFPHFSPFTGDDSMAFNRMGQSAQSDASLGTPYDLTERLQQYIGHDKVEFGTTDQRSFPHGGLDDVIFPPLEPSIPCTETTPNLHPPCYKCYLLDEYDVIDRDLDLGALQTPPTSEHGLGIYLSPGPQEFTELCSGHVEQNVSVDYSDIDGEYVTDDEYQPPDTSLPSESVVEFDESSLAEKRRRAIMIIKQQAREHSLAKRLGQDIRVVRESWRVRFEGVYWYAPNNDTSIPTTEADQRACAEQLIAAMRSNQGFAEVSATKISLNRCASESTHYTWEDFESIAWNVVDVMVDIHTNGWTKKLFDQRLRDQVQETMFYTFGDRLDALIQLLAFSKRNCEDLLKLEHLYTTIGDPFELEVLTSSEAASNKNQAKRDAWDELEGRAGKRTRA
jgi:hypothetical protein